MITLAIGCDDGENTGLAPVTPGAGGATAGGTEMGGGTAGLEDGTMTAGMMMGGASMGCIDRWSETGGMTTVAPDG